MSLIVHYCICDKGLNCPLTQSALKLQELVKNRRDEVCNRANSKPFNHTLSIVCAELNSLVKESKK